MCSKEKPIEKSCSGNNTCKTKYVQLDKRRGIEVTGLELATDPLTYILSLIIISNISYGENEIYFASAVSSPLLYIILFTTC